MGENNNHSGERGPVPVDRGSEEVPATFGSDRFYRAMAVEARRRVLYHLVETGASTVEELATVLTGWDATGSGRVEPAGVRDRWTVELRHVHLPHLAEADLLEYDPERGTVEAVDLDPAVRDLVADSVAAGER
jgi:hypothetical protein